MRDDTKNGCVADYVHRGQTYLTASHSQLRYFCYFLISRQDGENNGFLAGVPLLPPRSLLVSRPNSLPLPLPFRTPATQASSLKTLVCGLAGRRSLQPPIQQTGTVPFELFRQ